MSVVVVSIFEFSESKAAAARDFRANTRMTSLSSLLDGSFGNPGKKKGYGVTIHFKSLVSLYSNTRFEVIGCAAKFASKSATVLKDSRSEFTML